jgi:hypothetical protein
MGTTSNYSWPIPEDTDLVKNGAEAIRDLGNAIDTSAADFGGGLVHINTTSFSAVASQNIVGVFSSAYRTYKIILSAEGSATQGIIFRLLSGTTPLTTDYVSRDSAFGSSYSTSTSTSQFFIGTTRGAGEKIISESILTNPFLAVQTTGITIHNDTSTTDPLSAFPKISGNKNTLTNSYDGFQLSVSSGNITGVVTIYGVKE